ncbi:phage minor head protein [Rikenella microfusus]|uniref:Phage head morphogenesis protein, SPP1 gp7 family n=1 Tax=Rikenella microfusus TaxID=28139 RepID=A0A379MRY3_9BACT|nr:phage minor head protein [Rikenella microfusus]SUE33660.1 phage head morphogenesis protein, SPP1 gp7 family [Rikenella microfusus]
MQWLHAKGEFSPEAMREEPAAAMIRETHALLREAMDAGVADSVIPPAMARKLDGSLFLFSGFKTAQELKEASSLLRRPDGTVKGFAEFLTDVRRIDANYNVHYLEAEYNFAVASAQMAASWAEVQEEGDRYDLQYRTMGDNHVRQKHRALNGITLPPSNPFWKKYYPPNDWGCRCTARQVRRGKFPASDPAEAMRRGDEATDSPKQKIFRFNPGIDKQLFPPKHPYYKLSQEAQEQVRKVVVELKMPDIDLEKLIPQGRVTNEHIKTVMTEHARLFPDDYRGGLIRVDIASNGQAFMSNGRFTNGKPGNILTVHSHAFRLRSGSDIVEFNPAKEVREAFAALKKGNELTFNQEYALESLWHETLHAKARGVADWSRWNNLASMQMETVNQFVARHTYPDFIARFGGEAAHQDSVLDNGYGYGTWIRNFRAILKRHRIDEAETVEALRDKLLNEPYEKVGEYAVEFLKGKGVKNAQELMENLNETKQRFEARL